MTVVQWVQIPCIYFPSGLRSLAHSTVDQQNVRLHCFLYFWMTEVEFNSWGEPPRVALSSDYRWCPNDQWEHNLISIFDRTKLETFRGSEFAAGILKEANISVVIQVLWIIVWTSEILHTWLRQMSVRLPKHKCKNACPRSSTSVLLRLSRRSCLELHHI